MSHHGGCFTRMTGDLRDFFMKCKTTIEIWDSFASSFIEVVMLGFLVYKGGSQILW